MPGRPPVSLDEVIARCRAGTYTPVMLGEPIPIRAHALLCLQGFRGKGYSPGFVKRMAEVATQVRQHPEQLVQVIASSDTFCKVCPHEDDGCTLGGEGHETHIRAQDADILERLDIEAGTILPYQSIVRRLSVRIQGFELGGICTTCPWLPLGWCAEGLDAAQHALRHGAHDPA